MNWVVFMTVCAVVMFITAACAAPQSSVEGFEFDLVHLAFESGVR